MQSNTKHFGWSPSEIDGVGGNSFDTRSRNDPTETALKRINQLRNSFACEGSIYWELACALIKRELKPAPMEGN